MYVGLQLYVLEQRRCPQFLHWQKTEEVTNPATYHLACTKCSQIVGSHQISQAASPHWMLCQGARPQLESFCENTTLQGGCSGGREPGVLHNSTSLIWYVGSHCALHYRVIPRSHAIRQGCISCGILVSGIWARGVSSEHMENMEMFSCSPT